MWEQSWDLGWVLEWDEKLSLGLGASCWSRYVVCSGARCGDGQGLTLAGWGLVYCSVSLFHWGHMMQLVERC